MKQKHYRVYLYPQSNSICNEIAMWAVKGNGVPETRFSLSEMELMFKMEQKKFPGSNNGYECHLFPNSLTIDYTETNRNYETRENEKTTVCVLMIEDVELFVIEQEKPPYIPEESTEDHGTIVLTL